MGLLTEDPLARGCALMVRLLRGDTNELEFGV